MVSLSGAASSVYNAAASLVSYRETDKDGVAHPTVKFSQPSCLNPCASRDPAVSQIGSRVTLVVGGRKMYPSGGEDGAGYTQNTPSEFIFTQPGTTTVLSKVTYDLPADRKGETAMTLNINGKNVIERTNTFVGIVVGHNEGEGKVLVRVPDTAPQYPGRPLNHEIRHGTQKGVPFTYMDSTIPRSTCEVGRDATVDTCSFVASLPGRGWGALKATPGAIVDLFSATVSGAKRGASAVKDGASKTAEAVSIGASRTAGAVSYGATKTVEAAQGGATRAADAFNRGQYSVRTVLASGLEASASIVKPKNQ